jgi:hypothetical protein
MTVFPPVTSSSRLDTMVMEAVTAEHRGAERFTGRKSKRSASIWDTGTEECETYLLYRELLLSQKKFACTTIDSETCSKNDSCIKCELIEVDVTYPKRIKSRGNSEEDVEIPGISKAKIDPRKV